MIFGLLGALVAALALGAALATQTRGARIDWWAALTVLDASLDLGISILDSALLGTRVTLDALRARRGGHGH